MARIDQVLSGEKSWGSWWLDQLGHLGLGTAWATIPVVILYGFLDHLAAAFWVGSGAALSGGIGREIFQYLGNRKPNVRDRTLDALFHIPGGAVAVGLAALVKIFT